MSRKSKRAKPTPVMAAVKRQEIHHSLRHGLILWLLRVRTEIGAVEAQFHTRDVAGALGDRAEAVLKGLGLAHAQLTAALDQVQPSEPYFLNGRII